MKNLFKLPSTKLGLAAVVAVTVVATALSTGVVMAAIPDSNGNLNTCYRNNGGDLRVIDTAVESCANNETAFNLSQAVANSSTAYFRVKDGSVDTAALRNIVAYQHVNDNSFGWCVQTSFDPEAAYGHVAGYGGSTTLAINVKSLGSRHATNINANCASNFNVFLPSGDSAFDVAVRFEK